MRARGVAVVRGEWRADESAVAVPVFGPAGVVAALELTGRAFPLAAVAAGPFPLAAAAPALVVAARALGRRLADDPVALPSGTGPEPLRWPVRSHRPRPVPCRRRREHGMTTTGDVRPPSLLAEELLPGILDLERLEVDLFRGRSPRENLQRVFGGQVAGQALVAAGRTVPADRSVHSLHAYFLRPGDPAAPIVYAVDRIRDGRSFTTRRVVATQHGKAIFTLSASFHVAEDGAEHQFAMPDVPLPDEVPLWQDRLREFGDRVPARWLRPRPIEVRYIGDPPWVVRDPVAAGDAHTMVLDAGGRDAARRPAAARLRGGLRQRHDAARLGARGAAAGVGRRLGDGG